MTLQELEHLKQRILSERGLNEARKSPRVTVGMGTCGLKAGAAPVLEQLREELKDSSKVVVTYTGCIGLCTFEPIVEVALPGRLPVIYGRMTPEKAKKVVQEHILGGEPVSDLLLPVRALPQ